MGGRLDATNVVLPRICVLTPIEKEHTAILGETLAEIAFEKGGILKTHIPVQSSAQYPEVAAVLNEIAFRKNCEMNYLPDSIDNIKTQLSPDGTQLTIEPKLGKIENYTLPNIGDVFASNAALAILTVRHLSAIDLIETLSPATIRKALKTTFIPGRFQIIGQFPSVIVDPAHTPRSVKNSAETFKKIIKGKRILIFAAAKDKNTEEIAASVAKMFSQIFITHFDGFKTSNSERDYRVFQTIHKKTVFEPDPHTALEKAKDLLKKKKKDSEDGGILITGSFYLISQFLRQEDVCIHDSFPD